MSSNYLFELGTEELPPKALKSFTEALRESVTQSLNDAGLTFDSLRAFNSPRRLALQINGLEDNTPLSESKIWGPPAKVAFENGKPTKAALGFCARNNIDIAETKIESDGKVDKICCTVKQGGEKAETLLPVFIQTALDRLPIPKRMRWAASRTEFVRPVHWLILMKNSELLPATILGVDSGTESRGHRFLSEGSITIDAVDSYVDSLEQSGKVIVDPEKRRAMIVDQVEKLASTINGNAVIDPDLLDEVTALVEWPIAVMGNFDDRFLSVPSEALISSMKEHQKYFHLVDDKGRLLPNFITISNIETEDYSAIISGNEKVIRPRLDDAAFFFETDKKTSLSARREKLKNVIFQAKLGTIYDKTERIAKISEFICSKLNIVNDDSLRAASLCKSDLVSAMVYEFSDMQGIAGRHYALNDGENTTVASAIAEHYLPKFAGDELPSTDAGSVVAIADRVDTIVGIFGIGQNPTGSKDPFALRRASVALLRLMVENNYRLDLKELLEFSASLFDNLPKKDDVVGIALSYILDRFKAWFEERKISGDVFASVTSKDLSEPLDIYQRVLAVADFYKSDDAKALASANKRVANILAKLDDIPQGEINESLLQLSEERDLAVQVKQQSAVAIPLFEKREYAEGLSKLSTLRSAVDAFFDHVMVMDENLALRENRLVLLSQLRQLFYKVADISVLAPSK